MLSNIAVYTTKYNKGERGKNCPVDKVDHGLKYGIPETLQA